MTTDQSRWVVFNPHGRNVESLPVIYGFNNGGAPGWLIGCLIAEDGTMLGDHCCSSECYMPHDLGVVDGHRRDRHERFREHYPDGYRMEFVGYNAVRRNEKLLAAIALSNASADPSKQEGQP